MEWRQQTSLSCADSFTEAQRWIEEVTGKSFDCSDFRGALENGVLLCDLINKLKPGIIKRVNRLSTPIAGLDNVSVFLKACGKLGLNESQLFHPGDLQDLSTRVTLKRDESSRRLKNVLITIYWLGRKANQDLLYEGPQLNFKSFEGLLGLALSRALDDSTSCYYQEKEEIQRKRSSYKRQSSLDSVDSLDAKATTANGCGSDAEAEQVFKTETPPTSAPPQRGRLPAPLKKTKDVRGETSGTGPMSRSKSLTDIPMVYPVRNIPEDTAAAVLDEAQEPDTTQFKRKSSSTKDTEAQWHEDLNKWKSRRRSSKTEGRRASQDREHVIHQMTNGAKSAFQKTITQGGPMKRDQPSQHSPAAHPYPPTSPAKSSRSNLRPHTRAPLARSYATEMPYNSPTTYYPQTSGHIQGPTVGTMPEPIKNALDKDTHMASLASVGTAATTPSTEQPFSSQTHVKNVRVTSQNVTGDACGRSPVLPKEMTKLNAAAEDLTIVGRAEIDAKNAPTKTRTQKQEVNMEAINVQGLEKFLPRSSTWTSSASLPRGYRRSEGSSRLSSVISARPFGTKPSRVSSLPKLYNVDDNQLNWLSNNDKDVSPPVTSSLKRQTATVQLKGHAPVTQTENCAIQTRERPTQDVPQHSSSTRGKESSAPVKVDHSDMRVCLTLRPNSRPDFGFQTHWDSSGARVTSIHPGSPAELCRLRINDEIIAVDGGSVSQLNFNQWKNKMTSALQTGILTMDIRRYGNRDWSNSEASFYTQPGQNRTTLDLTSSAPLLIGRPDRHANTDTALMAPSKFNGQPNNVNSCQNMDGEHSDNPRTATKKGGSESAISDLQVPSLSPSSGSWSWDREEERRRQEKWQEEQQRLLQEKYQRDHERLEREFKKAQQDASIDKKDETKMITSDENPQNICLHVNGMTNKPQDEHGPATNEVKSAESSSCKAKETQPEKPSDAWAKSTSTPALTSPQKQTRGAGDQRKRKSQMVSKVEQERLQILEEMKKRTQLLTDNSWIRQRSASFYKEPVMPGVPIKRYESMDHLESWRHSPVASMTFTYPRPQSAAAGYCGSTRTSSSRHSTGSMPPQRSRTDPGRRTCSVCEGALDSGTVVVVQALSLSFHLSCFQCMGCYRDLRGAETGVEVRIHDQRPYCDACYFHRKYTGAVVL
ncbi:LIM domain only protein 7b isoform X2 [Periophthalmus magnuspinnatus]|uniref:LIM domain only protein 7b isoform X2 n=1 Tax=Periophthalmus magnuspinnatus TaxID=409849 RepID=UPI0024363ED1|nr:LIM domain only protein 7b isoform X2 [Periophthalmus magnuspinnatus]